MIEGVQGGTVTDSVPATETVCFIQGTYCSTTAHGTQSNKYITLSDFLTMSGNTVTLLEPPEDDPVSTLYFKSQGGYVL